MLKLKMIGLVFALLVSMTVALADGVTVCRDTSVDWLRFKFEGIVWNAEVAPWYVADGATPEGDTLIADANTSGEYVDQVVFAYWGGEDYILVIGDASTVPCDSGWQPSAPQILIPAPGGGPYLLEIQDAYGNWSLVTDEAHPHGIPLYNNGGHVELIGSVGQDVDPAHYRLIDPNAE